MQNPGEVFPATYRMWEFAPQHWAGEIAPISQQDPPLQPQPKPQKNHKTRQETLGNHEQPWQKIWDHQQKRRKPEAESNTKETTPTDIQRK